MEKKDLKGFQKDFAKLHSKFSKGEINLEEYSEKKHQLERQYNKKREVK